MKKAATSSQHSQNVPRQSRARFRLTRVRIRVPRVLHRLFHHPLLGFGPGRFEEVIHARSELPLETLPLIDPTSFESKTICVNLQEDVLNEFNEVAARRNCTTETLINSAIADWLSDWYIAGRPKSFLEICK